MVLRNHSHRLRKGGMLRCLGFWRLGESQTLYKESVQWECVCVCAWSEFTPLKHEVQPQQDMDMHLQFSQSVVYVGGFSFYSGMLSLNFGCVFSKSLSYKVSLFRQFLVGGRLCRANSAEVWFIYCLAHSCHSWNLILKTIEIILAKNEYTYSGYVWENDVLWSIVTVYIQWICVREWRIVEYYNIYTAQVRHKHRTVSHVSWGLAVYITW